jgi:hypothetical protein
MEANECEPATRLCAEYGAVCQQVLYCYGDVGPFTWLPSRVHDDPPEFGRCASAAAEPPLKQLNLGRSVTNSVLVKTEGVRCTPTDARTPRPAPRAEEQGWPGRHGRGVVERGGVRLHCPPGACASRKVALRHQGERRDATSPTVLRALRNGRLVGCLPSLRVARSETNLSRPPSSSPFTSLRGLRRRGALRRNAPGRAVVDVGREDSPVWVSVRPQSRL